MDIQDINRRTITQFRAGGEIEGMQRDRLVLLTTTGRRTPTPSSPSTRRRPSASSRSSR